MSIFLNLASSLMEKGGFGGNGTQRQTAAGPGGASLLQPTAPSLASDNVAPHLGPHVGWEGVFFLKAHFYK